MSLSTRRSATTARPLARTEVAHPAATLGHVVAVAPHADERRVLPVDPLRRLAPGLAGVAQPQEGQEVDYLMLRFGRELVVLFPQPLGVHVSSAGAARDPRRPI